MTLDGLAGRCPVGGATYQGFGRALQRGSDNSAEQGLDRAHGGAAQNLADQPLPAPTVGPGFRPGPGAGPLRVRCAGAGGGAIGNRGGREFVDRRAERVVEFLEAVQPTQCRRSRIEEATGRPGAGGNHRRVLDRPPLIVQDEGEHRALARQLQLGLRHPGIRIGPCRKD
ncbi:hypothetical protein [Streptomyces sp. MNU77]|uniref:hypothetical protein n=1 Tax=Streptomyces sp. MNU77 TaxID=1573406 RepID=UPI001C4B80B8|nr:hypothetical protein [Streptomyces sp. MNU77]